MSNGIKEGYQPIEHGYQPIEEDRGYQPQSSAENTTAESQSVPPSGGMPVSNVQVEE